MTRLPLRSCSFLFIAGLLASCGGVATSGPEVIIEAGPDVWVDVDASWPPKDAAPDTPSDAGQDVAIEEAAADVVTEEADTPDGPHVLTVYDIQDVSSAWHPAEGTTVDLAGLVVTYVWWSSTVLHVWVREQPGGPHAGIRVFQKRGTCDYDPPYKAGDLVSVHGVYQEHYGSSEIVADTVTQQGTTAMPQPLELSVPVADPEQYEGDFVKQCGVCEVVAVLQTGNVETTCGLVGTQYHGQLNTTLHGGDQLGCVTGLLDYAYGNYMVLPRDDRDLTCAAGPCMGIQPGCVTICSGKCAGAWDGCGGYCGDSACDGCCQGTTCRAGTSSAACGSGGGKCALCNDCEVCQEGGCIE